MNDDTFDGFCVGDMDSYLCEDDGAGTITVVTCYPPEG